MISEKCQGKWEVLCKEGYLSVRHIEPESLCYRILDTGELNEDFNAKWYGTTLNRFTREELKCITWPNYLKPGESEIITVTSSGNFYVE